MRKDFSYLSASWPAVAEKRKNGSINSPATTVIKICAFNPFASARRKVIKITRAFLNKLSLKAPKN